MWDRDALVPLRACRRQAGFGRLGVIGWILALAAAALIRGALFHMVWDRVLFAPVDAFAHHEPDARYEAVSLSVHPKKEAFDPRPRLLVFQGPATVRTTGGC